MFYMNIVSAISYWFCALIFGFISLWAFIRKDPMTFWSGKAVSPNEITDIRSYNKANGYMWLIYTLSFAIAGVIAVFNTIFGVILLLIIIFPGLFVLINAYKKIYNKYSNKKFKIENVNFNKNNNKSIILTIIFTILILIGVSIMFIIGEKEPKVILNDNNIEINTMYGVKIDYSEILEINLIDAKASQIDFGIRTNGFDGFGHNLKGNFKSNSMGNSLVYVYTNSSPVIQIKRENKTTVYINFKNSDKTMILYQDLLAVFDK